MPVCRAVVRTCLFALWLAGCAGGPSGDEVIAQAGQGGQVAFDVVKIDDAVMTALRARPQPGFAQRFKTETPPPELKIAVGDTVSAVIWESAANGLFGNSLTEVTLPAGAAARASTEPVTSLRGLSALPLGLTTTPDLLAFLFGGAAARDLAGAATLLPDLSAEAAGRASFGLPSAGAANALGGAGLSLEEAERRLGGGGFGAVGGLAAGAGNRAAPGLEGRLERGAELIDAGRLARLQQLIDMARQSGRPGTRVPDQAVGSDGAISIPYAGRIEVAGRTPSEVERTIEQLLGPKALDPQALVVIRRSVANSVSVAGEAVRGRRVPLTLGGDRLLQVIAAAGGGRAPVHETLVRLSRGDVTATVPLATLVSDPAQDIFAEPGDVLTLVRQPKSFTVFGAVGRNAIGANSTITFTRDRLSLSEALAQAGGLLDERADPRAVFLFRYEPDALVRALGQPIASGAHDGLSPIVYRLDLKEAKSYLLAKEFPVHDKDVIFVANAEVVPLYYFFQALATITGPVTTTLSVCSATKC